MIGSTLAFLFDFVFLVIVLVIFCCIKKLRDSIFLSLVWYLFLVAIWSYHIDRPFLPQILPRLLAYLIWIFHFMGIGWLISTKKEIRRKLIPLWSFLVSGLLSGLLFGFVKLVYFKYYWSFPRVFLIALASWFAFVAQIFLIAIVNIILPKVKKMLCKINIIQRILLSIVIPLLMFIFASGLASHIYYHQFKMSKTWWIWSLLLIIVSFIELVLWRSPSYSDDKN